MLNTQCRHISVQHDIVKELIIMPALLSHEIYITPNQWTVLLMWVLSDSSCLLRHWYGRACRPHGLISLYALMSSREYNPNIVLGLHSRGTWHKKWNRVVWLVSVEPFAFLERLYLQPWKLSQRHITEWLTNANWALVVIDLLFRNIRLSSRQWI